MNFTALFSFLFLTSIAFGQDTFLEIHVRAMQDDTGKPLTGVKVDLVSSNQIIKTTYTDTLGKSKMTNISIDSAYQVKFSYPGYVTKMVEIAANPFDDAPPGAIVQKMAVSMIKPLTHENLAALDTVPMVKFYWRKDHMITFDSQQVKEQMKTLEYCRNGYTYEQSSNYLKELSKARDFEKDGAFISACNAYLKAKTFIDNAYIREQIDRLVPLAKLETISFDCVTYDDYIYVADGYFELNQPLQALKFYRSAYDEEHTAYTRKKIKECVDLLSEM